LAIDDQAGMMSTLPVQGLTLFLFRKKGGTGLLYDHSERFYGFVKSSLCALGGKEAFISVAF